MLRVVCATAVIVLTGSACSSQRAVSRENIATYSTERSERVMDSVALVLRDTLREVTTVTIQIGEAGDTLFRGIVTDRIRARSCDNRVESRMRTEVRMDTVFIEKRDSIEIRSRPFKPLEKGSNLVGVLKWGFYIIIALIGLVFFSKRSKR